MGLYRRRLVRTPRSCGRGRTGRSRTEAEGGGNMAAAMRLPGAAMSGHDATVCRIQLGKHEGRGGARDVPVRPRPRTGAAAGVGRGPRCPAECRDTGPAGRLRLPGHRAPAWRAGPGPRVAAPRVLDRHGVSVPAVKKELECYISPSLRRRRERGKAPSLACSFCGKPRDHTRRLVDGPGVYIRAERIGLCDEVLSEP